MAITLAVAWGRDLANQVRKACQGLKDMKPPMTQGRFGSFQRPGQAVWHMNAPGTGLQRRDHVRAKGIADHHRLIRASSMPGKDRAIGVWRLVADDLDSVEEVTKTGLRQLSFLVQKIALGDQYHAVLGGQGRHGASGVGQKLDRMFQHLATGSNQFGNDPCGDARLGHLDRSFDHRQRESLDAEPIVTKVPSLCGLQSFGKMVRLGMVRQKPGKSLLREAEERLVLPQGIVGIEANRRQHCSPKSRPPFRPFKKGYISGIRCNPRILQTESTCRVDPPAEHV